MPRFVLLLAMAVTLVRGLMAQCPAIQFVSSSVVSTYPAGVVASSGLQRIADGSFTRHTYNRTAPYARTQTTPGFQSNFIACSGRTAVTPTPPVNRPLLSNETLGKTSRQPFNVDLANNGTATVLLAGAFFGFPDQVFVAQTNADGTTKSTATYGVGQSPDGILVADFNNDGKKDAFTLNVGSGSGPGSFSVLLGNGDGTLKPATTIATTFQPGTAAASDLNGDGKIDLVITTASSPGGVAVYIGNGDGTFKTPVSYEAGSFAIGITIADINSDSKPDLVVADPGGSYSTLTGNGDGTFKAATTVLTGFLGLAVDAADFNKDGKVDLVFVDTSRKVAILLLGTGNGTFSTQSTYVLGGFASYVLAMDFDWDGNMDMVTAAGHPEALTGAYREEIQVLFGRGDGTFHAAPAYSGGNSTMSMVNADFNGDGKPDLATASRGSGAFNVMLGNGGDSFQTPTTVSILGATGLTSIASADFNGDGKADIVVTDASGVYVALGNGNGTFQTATNFSAGANPQWVATGDLNGDNKADLAVANGGSGAQDQGSVVILINNGNGGFGAPVNLTAGSKPFRVVIADFNGDGKRDVVSINGGTANSTSDPGGTSVFLGNGNGTFQGATNYSTGFNPSALLAGDVNGDGKVDLLVASKPGATSSNNQIGVLLGTGSGTFGAATNAATSFGPVSMTMADYNKDGKQDLIVAHCCGNTDMTFLVGNGDGTFQAEVHFAAGDSPSAVVSADFNADTKTDIAVAHAPNFAQSFVGIFLNISGSGAPASPTISSPAVGTTFGAGAVTFTWNAVAGATKYKLEIGSAAGASDLFSQETTGTSLTVNGLPTDGRTLYARISSFGNNVYSTPAATTYRAYFVATPLKFVPLPPCRVMETRALYNFEGRTGAFGPPTLNAAETRTLNLPASNVCSIPSHAKAFVVNVTVIPNGGGVNFVTLWPAGETRPNTWTIRSPDGQIVANSAIVKAGANGGIGVYTSDKADFLIDISGYYTDSTAVTGLVYYPLTPCRVIDTRALYRSPAGPFGPPSMTARETRKFRFPAATQYCNIPAAAAYSVTLTAVPPASLAYLTAWPDGSSQPNVSSINSFAGRVLANSVIIPASADGTINVFAFDATDFLIDINGYYAPDNGSGLFYFPVTQCRANDSTVSGGTYLDNTARTINIPAEAGCSGIPSSAKGYAVNVTALPNGNPMPFITAYPTGQARPNASILNAFQGQIVSNSAIIPAGTNGAIDVYAFTRTDIVVEVSGYFGR